MKPPRLAIAIEKFTYPDGTAALTDIRLEISHGDFCALLGANGSGKTTLLKAMDGLLRDYRGTVLLDGQNILKLHPRDIYRKVGLVFQNPDDQLFAHSVEEDVAFGPRNMGFAEDEVSRRVATALLQVEMTGDAGRNIHHLSYGQKKRVCIAGLLAMGHEILLLDEPTAGLDPLGELQMMALLHRLNRNDGVTIVMATHSVDMVPLFIDQVHVLSRGGLVRSGSPAEVFSSPLDMAAVKLRLPQVAELFWQLVHEEGLPADGLPLTVGEARQKLVKQLKKLVR